jgi:hypothetical protein
MIPGMIEQILWRNQGQVLTPELIVGILHGCNFTPDNSVASLGIAPMEYKGVTFAVERIADIQKEIAPLHDMHWRESESFRHGLPLSPNYSQWIADERAGSFILFTVRELGILMGYCQVYVTTSNHTGTKICNEDALFLHPGVRRGLICAQFAKYSESVVKRLGVREVRLSVKVTNEIWKLWERMGYQRTGYELVKILED